MNVYVIICTNVGYFVYLKCNKITKKYNKYNILYNK